MYSMSWERPSEALLELLKDNLEGVECEMRKMFGQYAFFMNGNMFCGVHQSNLFLRLAQEDVAEEMSLHPELKRFEPREGMVMKEYLQTPPEFAENRNSFRGLLTKSIEYARRLPPKSEAK